MNDSMTSAPLLGEALVRHRTHRPPKPARTRAKALRLALLMGSAAINILVYSSTGWRSLSRALLQRHGGRGQEGRSAK